MSPPTQVPKRSSARQLERVGRHAVELLQRLRDLVVERRHDAIQDLGEIEQHVLALVRDGELLARMILGLPAGGDLGAHRAPELRAAPCGVSVGIQPIEQQPRDVLLLAQHRAARRSRSGCAVNTGSMRSCPGARAPARASGPRLERASAASTPPGCGRSLSFTKILAPAADAVHLLGEVDHLEPVEKARTRSRAMRRRPPLDARDELDAAAWGRLRAGAMAATRSCSTRSNSSARPARAGSRRRARPSACTSSRSASCCGGKWI